MSMNMPDELPRYVSASREMHEENKGTVFDTGVVHRPRTKEQYKAQPTTDHKALPERAPSVPTRPRTRAVTSEADFDDLAENGAERPAAPRPGGRNYLNDPAIDMGSKVETHGLSTKDARAKTSKRRRAKRRQNAATLGVSRATANDPMRSETALNAESNEAHDRNNRKRLDNHVNALRPFEFQEEMAFAHTQMQESNSVGGVPDWASKAFAEQTLEKGPVEGSRPRGLEPADATYESAASKDPFVSTMGPGAGSKAATRTKEAYDKTFDWGEGLAPGISKLTGANEDAIRKLEGTGPEWEPSKPGLKAYDPESVPTAQERVIKARRGVRDNEKQHEQRYKKPEKPLTKRESEPEPKRSMFQRLKDRFK